MGFSISWMALRGKIKEKILAEAGLVETTDHEEVPESPICGAMLNGGWYLLFFNDVDHPLLQQAERLSADCELIGCQAEEHIMVSTAFGFRNGGKLWYLSHDSEKGIYNIGIEGTPPSIFGEVQDHLRNKQDERGREEPKVDYIFDVPIETAERVCGYRHDHWEFTWGRPDYVRLITSSQGH